MSLESRLKTSVKVAGMRDPIGLCLVEGVAYVSSSSSKSLLYVTFRHKRAFK